MKVIRFAEKNWRPDTATLIHTGDYRVPEDMPLELAQRAVAEGVAVVVDAGDAPSSGKKKHIARSPETK